MILFSITLLKYTFLIEITLFIYKSLLLAPLSSLVPLLSRHSHHHSCACWSLACTPYFLHYNRCRLTSLIEGSVATTPDGLRSCWRCVPAHTATHTHTHIYTNTHTMGYVPTGGVCLLTLQHTHIHDGLRSYWRCVPAHIATNTHTNAHTHKHTQTHTMGYAPNWGVFLITL
jgi:hypothetical protein